MWHSRISSAPLCSEEEAMAHFERITPDERGRVWTRELTEAGILRRAAGLQSGHPDLGPQLWDGFEFFYRIDGPVDYYA